MKRLWLPAAALLLFFVLAPAVSWAQSDSTVSAQPPEGAMNGVWKGEGMQDNGSSWTIVATIGDGKYSIEYPSLSCKGILGVSEKTNGYIRAVENIISGREKCIDGGVVILVWRTPREIDYLWYYPDGRFGAIGVLKKSR